jgi:undecaprenyldiphospho-muramoylpentapeptide beta-N-acetylglucosaminyltransferase
VRLLICAGASGGGVYPALAVLHALQDKIDEVLWAGSRSGMEASLVSREGIPFAAVPAAGVHGVGARALPNNLVELGRGYRAGTRLLESFEPDILFFTGGYVAVPLALAGRNLPIVLFVPDIEPGLALRSVSRFADKIAVPVDDSHNYFRPAAPLTTTGYPVREELTRWHRANSREELGIDGEEDTLLVYGGSKGARSINRALFANLGALLPAMRIVHISGELDWPAVEKSVDQLPEELRARYFPFPYLHDRMGAAMASADLVVARAGASTLGEFPAFELPAILIPYPHAWRYQRVNARYLVDRGGGVMLNDEDLPDKLASTVLELMADEDKRANMRIATRKLFQPDAARRIGDLILDASLQEKVRRAA